MKKIIYIILITLSLHVATYASTTVGSITALRGDVKVNDASTSKQATLGLKLYEKNNILTGKKSKAQFIFKDETIVTVGKNSNFSISKYMDETLEESTIELGLVKGAIKTITGEIGKIAPQKFSVQTKTATIGIRGTNFTTSLLDDNSLMAYCTYGAINVNYKGKDYLVKQGFYIVISPDGVVEVKEFDSNQLRQMHERFFGAMHSPKGKTNKDGTDTGNGVIIDETTEVVTDVVITDVSDEVQGKEQADKQDDVNDNPDIYISMSGFDVIDNPYSDINAYTSLKFLEDGSLFDSANSFTEANDISNGSGNGESDNWRFVISSTPTAYTSREDFSTTFSSVILTPLASSTSVNASLDPGSTFIATADDLVDGDYMTWGSWSADVTFESVQSGSLMADSRSYLGFWVSGEPTDASVVNAMKGTKTYNGIYRAIDINNGTVNGVATLGVDFGLSTGTLNIGTFDYTFTNMSIVGNTITGNTVIDGTGANQIGSTNGTFYGPNAEGVGGNFQFRDNLMTYVNGVYEVQ